MLFLTKESIGRRVVVKDRMSAPNQPFTIEPGARGVIKHVTTMLGQQQEPDLSDPGKVKTTIVNVPVAWVDFWGNGVCFAVIGEVLEFEDSSETHGAD